MLSFAEIEKSILNFMWKNKRTGIVKVIPEQKEQCWKYHNAELQSSIESAKMPTNQRVNKENMICIFVDRYTISM
jgi:F0F1-type ATP synthase delta subunit